MKLLKQYNECAFISVQERSGELERCQRSLEEVKGQLQSVEETKGWLERRLAETEVQTHVHVL